MASTVDSGDLVSPEMVSPVPDNLEAILFSYRKSFPARDLTLISPVIAPISESCGMDASPVEVGDEVQSPDCITEVEPPVFDLASSKRIISKFLSADKIIAALSEVRISPVFSNRSSDDLNLVTKVPEQAASMEAVAFAPDSTDSGKVGGRSPVTSPEQAFIPEIDIGQATAGLNSTDFPNPIVPSGPDGVTRSSDIVSNSRSDDIDKLSAPKENIVSGLGSCSFSERIYKIVRCSYSP